MKLKNIKYITCAALLLSVASCKKDILQETNPNEVSTDIYFTNLKETNTGLNSVYNALLDEDILGIAQEAWRSDMGWPGFGRPIPNGSVKEGINFYFHSVTNSLEYVNNKWQACYKAIFFANQVIEALEKLQPTLKTADELALYKVQMGQARFVRGLMHFYLHSAYNKGSVIIRDKVPISADDYNKPLSSSQEVKDFFRADLKYAYDNLPAKYTAITDLGRATKGAAATILGTSFLYEKDYPTAKTYFNDVITNTDYGYALVKDLSLLFTTAGEFNSESIFELAYNTEHNVAISVFGDGVLSNTVGFLSTSNTGFFMPAWIISAYKNETVDINDPQNYYQDPTSPSGKRLYKLSKRARAMIATIEDEKTIFYKTDVTSANARFSSNGWGFGYYKKYLNYDILTAEGAGGTRGQRSSGKNITVNRLGDVYLMQAECLIKTGDVSGALKLMNAVRNRWALELLGPADAQYPGAQFNGTLYTDITLMNQLMYIDKPLEMSVEGNAIRWYDLRRWGILKSNFQNLASKTFYADSYTYTDLAGKSVTKAKTSVVTIAPANATGDAIINYEYDDAAINFNDNEAYLPIPSSELQANSALRK